MMLLSLFGVALATSFAVAAADVAAPPAERVPEVTEALRRAASAFRDLRAKAGAGATEAEVLRDLAGYNGLLREQAAHFPVVVPGTSEQVEFQRLTLNADRAGVDAIAFTAPAGESSRFGWHFFTVPADAVTWNIVRVDGGHKADAFPGFERFDRDRKTTHPDLPSGSHVTVQKHDTPLESEWRYLIWFYPEKNEPFELYYDVSLRQAK